MQLFDAIAWKTQSCDKTNQTVAKMAYIANIMQPIIIFMAFILISKVSMNFKILSTILIILYIIQLFYQSTDVKIKCLIPTQECSHLEYNWWDNINYIGYMIVLFSMFLFLVRSFALSMINLIYITITFIISAVIYKCGKASIWYWFAAFTPLINIIAYKYIQKKNDTYLVIFTLTFRTSHLLFICTIFLLMFSFYLKYYRFSL